jgi:hypothetical protein
MQLAGKRLHMRHADYSVKVREILDQMWREDKLLARVCPITQRAREYPPHEHSSRSHSKRAARATALNVRMKQSAREAHNSVLGDQTPAGPSNSGGAAVSGTALNRLEGGSYLAVRQSRRESARAWWREQRARTSSKQPVVAQLRVMTLA